MSIFNIASFDKRDLLIMIAARIFVLFCVLPIHEFAHALIADKLGDKTARLSGRLTISPLAHLDLVGSIMIVLLGFGYAKPVPVNPNNFKKPKAGMAITAAAGPISNLIMATVFLLIYNTFVFFGTNFFAGNPNLAYIISYFLIFASRINISLAVFNLLPVPPLDGSRLFLALLPDKYYFKVMQYERIIMIIIMILLLTGLLSGPINTLADWVAKGLNFIALLPFSLFN